MFEYINSLVVVLLGIGGYLIYSWSQHSNDTFALIDVILATIFMALLIQPTLLILFPPIFKFFSQKGMDKKDRVFIQPYEDDKSHLDPLEVAAQITTLCVDKTGFFLSLCFSLSLFHIHTHSLSQSACI